MLANSAVSNFLKSLAVIWIPAATTLYFTLAGIWHLPNTEQVIGSMTAVDAFLGVILGVASKSLSLSPPSDGNLIVDKTNPAKEIYRLDLGNTSLDSIAGKDQLHLKVTGPPPAPAPVAAV